MRKVKPDPAETTASTTEHIERPGTGTDAERSDDGAEQSGSGPIVPTLFDLLGHSLAAAHATSAAVAAQLNVALAAYRLLQLQRDSLGAENAETLSALLSDAERSDEVLRRILYPGRQDRAGTGGETKIPRTFGERRPGTEAAPHSADARGE